MTQAAKSATIWCPMTAQSGVLFSAASPSLLSQQRSYRTVLGFGNNRIAKYVVKTTRSLHSKLQQRYAAISSHLERKFNLFEEEKL